MNKVVNLRLKTNKIKKLYLVLHLFGPELMSAHETIPKRCNTKCSFLIFSYTQVI